MLEERGRNRDEISLLDRGYIHRIIGYPRDDKAKLLDDPNAKLNTNPLTKHKSILEIARDRFRKEGWPEWRIQEEVSRIEYYFNQSDEQRIAVGPISSNMTQPPEQYNPLAPTTIQPSIEEEFAAHYSNTNQPTE